MKRMPHRRDVSVFVAQGEATMPETPHPPANHCTNWVKLAQSCIFCFTAVLPVPILRFRERRPDERRALSPGESMASHPTRKRVIDSPVIPDRLYFKIGDVARLCGVEPYVLRFWETQFPQLKPNKSGTGQRLYRRREVEMALEIKRLVHGEGYTISGARHALESQRNQHHPAAVQPGPAARPQAASPEPAARPADTPKRPEAVVAAVGQIRAELREIVSLLSAQHPRPPRPRARVVTLSPESGSLFPL